MEYTKLGKTDIEVSRFCLGCMSLGGYSQCVMGIDVAGNCLLGMSML